MFDGCDALEDVYYEGSKEEWNRIKIVHQKQEIELGSLFPGTSVQKIEAQRLIHIPGNDALLAANIYFHCKLSDLACKSSTETTTGGKDVTGWI